MTGNKIRDWVDTLIANGIKVIKRNYDNANGRCLNSNFWVFDSRCTCAGSDIFVWTSSAQISNTGFYSDKNSPSRLMTGHSLIFTQEK